MIFIKNALIIIIISGIVSLFVLFSNDKSHNGINSEPKITIKRLQTMPKSIVETVAPKPEILTPVPSPIPSKIISNKKTYSTSVSYEVPNGTQSMSVTLILENGIIISANTTHSMTGKSASYQKNFQSSYQNQVIGKNINNINLSRVGGASITTNAFNQAIYSIRQSL